MSGRVWWYAVGGRSPTLHGPFFTYAAAAIDALRNTCEQSDVMIGLAPDGQRRWRTAIFGNIDETFDAANEDLALPDDPPSCSWSPEQMDGLKASLEHAFTCWLEASDHAVRRPTAIELTNTARLSFGELCAITRAANLDRPLESSPEPKA